jgi:hypothetical protein
MKSPLPPRVPASGSRQPNLVGGCGVPHRPSLTTCSHRSIVSSSFFDSVFLTQLLLTTIPSRKAIPPIRTLLHFISLIKVFIKKLSRSIATSPCNYRCNKYLKKILAIKATSNMPAHKFIVSHHFNSLTTTPYGRHVLDAGLHPSTALSSRDDLCSSPDIS